MKKTISLLFLLLLPLHAFVLLPAAGAQDAAKNVQPAQPAAVTLSNQDVVEMVGAKIESEIIVAKIKASSSNFDTSPAALQQLKAGGIADEIILAMIFANDGKLAASRPVAPSPSSADKVAVKIPGRTIVEIETAYNISSQDVRAGDAISFRVVNPVRVNDVVVISSGATATARIVKASRGGHFGRAGRLAWNMIEVTAVDGSRIPIQLSAHVVGDSKGAKVATRTVLTGLILGPAAPLALLHGFKRGENAFIPQGKRFEVSVQAESSVQTQAATQPR